MTAAIASTTKVNDDLASRGYPVTVAKKVQVGGITLRFNQVNFNLCQILILPPDHAKFVTSHHKKLQEQLMQTIITMPKELTNLIAQYAVAFFPSIPSTLSEYPLIESCVQKTTKNQAFSTNPCSIPATTVMVVCDSDEDVIGQEYMSPSKSNVYVQKMIEKAVSQDLFQTEITSEEHFPDRVVRATWHPLNSTEDFGRLDIYNDVSDAMLDHPFGDCSTRLILSQPDNASSQTQKPEAHMLHVIFYKLKDEETFHAPTLCELMSQRMVQYVAANAKFAELYNAKAEPSQTAATAVNSGIATAATPLSH